jgi:hypothetical protein
LSDRERETGNGDASACLKFRPPLTRRGCPLLDQIACPRNADEFLRIFDDLVKAASTAGPHRPVSETLRGGRIQNAEF